MASALRQQVLAAGFSAATPGTCGFTSARDTERPHWRCAHRNKGSFAVPHRLEHGKAALAAFCGAMCQNCSRCAAISFSTQHRDCSWFSRCSAEEVTNRVRGFLTMRRHGFEAPQSDPCAPDASLAEQRRCAVRAPDFTWLSPAQRAPWMASPPMRLRPRIYVYDGDVAWRTFYRKGVPGPKGAWAAPFGIAIDENETTTDTHPEYMFAVFARVQFHRTTSPEDADLFFVPPPQQFLHSMNGGSRWCERPTWSLDRYWRNGLNYFRRRGGRDHFTAFLWRESLFRSGWSMGTQQGACPQWIEELDVSNIVKLVGVMHCPWWNGTKREEDGFPGLLEVPYSPGGVHNLSLWRRANPAPRNTTVFGFFNTVGHRNAFRQMDLRVILERQCKEASRGVCLWGGASLNFGGFYDKSGLSVFRAMSTSIFSLQPAGDDPARLGILQSLKVGCIPVVFYPEQRELWPLHWGSWVNKSSIYIPAEDVLTGRVNVVDVLQAIPAQRVRRMQRAIALHAHRVVYGLQPDPSVWSSGSLAAHAAGDAFDITLDAILRRQGDY